MTGLRGQTVTNHVTKEPRQGDECVIILNQLMAGKTVKVQPLRERTATQTPAQVCKFKLYASLNRFLLFCWRHCFLKRYGRNSGWLELRNSRRMFSIRRASRLTTQLFNVQAYDTQTADQYITDVFSFYLHLRNFLSNELCLFRLYFS